MQNLTPRVYVADLAAYNSGILHGKWIDLCNDPDVLKDEFQSVLKYGEEWAIHDQEDCGNISEWESINSLCERYELLEEHNEVALVVMKYVSDLEDVKNTLDNYHGEYESLRDFAQNYVIDTDAMNDDHWLFSHLDFDSIGRYLECSYDIYESNGSIYVFNQF